MRPYISVVIPVFNSSGIIDTLYTRLTDVLTKKSWDYEIILVDDGSSDNSFDSMKMLHDRDFRVKAIKLDGNFGQQNAIMCGLHHAEGLYIVTMDDDLQNPPEEIEKLIDKLNCGYEVVYGIPRDKKHSSVRNAGSRMTDWLFNVICKKPKDIRVSSFRVMTRDTVEKIVRNKTSFVYISAILFRERVKIGNVSVIHDKRNWGESNYSILKLARLFVNLYLYYSPLSFWSGKSSSPQFVIKEIQI